jgi:uncharacterized protein with von Willebrand factor type A (vWA) domain
MGEPVEIRWRSPAIRPRPIAFLLDVSGSMTPFTRPILQFAAAALRGGAPAEVFCFGTRLTRVTDALAHREVDAGLAGVAERVPDWDGGTRIGESLKRLLDSALHVRHVRGSISVVFSDGLEVGEPALLGEQMARLARLAYRVVWLNPLKRDPGYRPLAGGMRAALPHVDHFDSGHDLEDLERLIGELARI